MKIFITILLLSFAIPMGAFAVEDVGVTESSGSSCWNQDSSFKSIVCLPGVSYGKDLTISSLFNTGFRLAIGIGAILAVFMLILGGFGYMTEEAVGAKKKARERIQNALLGLILLLVSYLVLFIIDPNIRNSIQLFETDLQGLQGTQTLPNSIHQNEVKNCISSGCVQEQQQCQKSSANTFVLSQDSTGKLTYECKVPPTSQTQYCYSTNCSSEKQQCEAGGGAFTGRFDVSPATYSCYKGSSDTSAQVGSQLTCKEQGCVQERERCQDAGGTVITTVRDSSGNEILQCTAKNI